MTSPLDKFREIRDDLLQKLAVDPLFVAWKAADDAVKQLEKAIGAQPPQITLHS